MDGMPDISKILGIIMENPEIIERIKDMAQGSSAESFDASAAENTAEQTVTTAADAAGDKSDTAEAAAPPRLSDKKRRHDLLCAIKPYVSSERSRAIDTMLSVVEILEIMKAR